MITVSQTTPAAGSSSLANVSVAPQVIQTDSNLPIVQLRLIQAAFGGMYAIFQIPRGIVGTVLRPGRMFTYLRAHRFPR